MDVKENIPFWKRAYNYGKAPQNAVPLKIAIFCFGGGAICVFPFMVLQMRVLGLTIKEIALIYLLIPVASLIGPIVSGMIADKLGRYNIVVATNMTLTILFFDLLLLIPAITLPPGTISLSENMTYEFIVDNCESCIPNTANVVTFNIKNCKYVGNGTESKLEKEHELYNIHHQESLIGNYTEKCHFNIMEISSVNLSSNSLFHPGSRDIVCGIEWNSECQEDMKTLYTNVFWQFLFFKFMGNLFAAATFTMCDASVLALSKQYNISVGKQKIMTMLAYAITPIISGILIDYHSNVVGYLSYFPAFMLCTGLSSVAIVIMLFLKIEAEKGSGNMLQDIKKLLTYKEVVLFYIVLIILGTNFGFIESYIFIYLTSLGASGFLLGFTLTVGCTFSIPMLYYADELQERVGRRNIYLFCFTCYAIRMAGYSYIWNPWMGLCFELLEAFTYQLMWVTSLKVFPLLAPKGLLATMTGIAGAIHYSVGKGVGGFIGGQIIAVVGMRLTFRIMSLLALAGGVFYFIIDKLVLGEKLAEREKEQKKEEMMEAEKAKESYPENRNGKEAYSALLAVPYENGLNLHAKQIKNDDLSSEESPGHMKKNVALSMPHLYALENLKFSKRHSLGGWISSEKLFL